MDLKHATILITGGSSGIGFELARQLVEKDNTVIITGRRQSALDEAQARIPDLHVYQADVSDAASIADLHAQVSADFPDLNVLINCAGAMRMIDLKRDHSLEDLTAEVEVNLKGVMWMTSRFLPQLARQPRAAVINISSALAFVPMAAAPIYSASKAGVRAYTRALREQLAGTTVEVFEVAPPSTDTPLLSGVQTSGHGSAAMSAERVARQAITEVQKGVSEIPVGLARVLRLLSHAAPGLAFKQVNRAPAAVPAHA